MDDYQRGLAQFRQMVGAQRIDALVQRFASVCPDFEREVVSLVGGRIWTRGGIDLKTLRPMPTVEGHSVPGGYSGQAVRPIALRQVMEVARANPGVAISGIGGIETGTDAAQFFLLGASTVQVYTGAMLRGYEIISELKAELEKFMVDHGFANLREFIGKSLPYFTTHHDLVDRQKSARDAKESARSARGKDVETWKGEIARETSALVTN